MSEYSAPEEFVCWLCRHRKKLINLLLEGKYLVFMNECHFYQHGTRIRAWYSEDNTDPKVSQEPNRKGISVLGAVGMEDGRLLTEITERYNALTFLKFLSPACV